MKLNKFTTLEQFEKWKYLECRRDKNERCMHEQCPSFVAAAAVDTITELLRIIDSMKSGDLAS